MKFSVFWNLLFWKPPSNLRIMQKCLVDTPICCTVNRILMCFYTAVANLENRSGALAGSAGQVLYQLPPDHLSRTPASAAGMRPFFRSFGRVVCIHMLQDPQTPVFSSQNSKQLRRFPRKRTPDEVSPRYPSLWLLKAQYLFRCCFSH